MSESQQNKEINDLIDRWHDQSTDIPLHEYLGMSWGEFVFWVENNVAPEDYQAPQYP